MASEYVEKYVGDGEVYLIAGGEKIYTDIAARFVGSERDVEEIIASPYSARLVDKILECGHLAATEFDTFIFGIQGYARVTEVQLVRKRLASYLIKSGRAELGGKRKFSMVAPKAVYEAAAPVYDPDGQRLILTGRELMKMIHQWYDYQLENTDMKEEDLRYLKPQATEFKAIISMNAHALLDWFKIRTCTRAQREIRDLATKMLRLCKQAAPDLFRHAGPSCVSLGYCPEGDQCCGRSMPRDWAEDLLTLMRKQKIYKQIEKDKLFEHIVSLVENESKQH